MFLWVCRHISSYYWFITYLQWNVESWGYQVVFVIMVPKDLIVSTVFVYLGARLQILFLRALTSSSLLITALGIGLDCFHALPS